MSIFFPDLLDGFLKLQFLEKVQRKYHYGEGQMDELKAAAEEMLPLIGMEAFWEGKAWHAPSKKDGQGERNNAAPDNLWEAVVISLGWGVDKLQESYSQKGMLSECYMLEVLASELLLDSYGAYNRHVQKNADWHVARYHFLGSEEEFPLEMLPGILEDIAAQYSPGLSGQFEKQKAEGAAYGMAGCNAHKMTCNSAFCIQPKKSVVFIAELTKNGRTRCPGICLGCGSIHCPNRMKEDSSRERLAARIADLPLHYGYGRIFGNSV